MTRPDTITRLFTTHDPSGTHMSHRTGDCACAGRCGYWMFIRQDANNKFIYRRPFFTPGFHSMRARWHGTLRFAAPFRYSETHEPHGGWCRIGYSCPSAPRPGFGAFGFFPCRGMSDAPDIPTPWQRIERVLEVAGMSANRLARHSDCRGVRTSTRSSGATTT